LAGSRSAPTSEATRAIDARTGKIVIVDKDPRVVLEKAKGRNHVVVHGRVPLADEPIYVGLG
jgi:hypothetical protein